MESSFVKGALAALVATISTYPLDLLRTQRAISVSCFKNSKIPYKSLLTFEGLLPTCLQVVPYMAIVFSVHENTKSSLGDFWAGGLAGMIGKTVIMPLDVIRRRLQVSHMQQSNLIMERAPLRASNLAGQLRMLGRMEGWRGAFAGWTMAVLKSAPGTALTFFLRSLCLSSHH